MQNEKERRQSTGAIQDEVIVTPQVLIAQSDTATQHHDAEPNATAKDQSVQGEYWEDEEDDFRSYLMRLLTDTVPFWMAWLPFLVFIVHMVTWHGWPWNPKHRV